MAVKGNVVPVNDIFQMGAAEAQHALRRVNHLVHKVAIW